MDALYTLSQIALIYLGVLPDNGTLEIPEDMTVKQAVKILQGNPKAIRQMHNQVLRDLEKPNTINDSQNHKIEAELEVSTRFKKIFNKERLNERYKNRHKSIAYQTIYYLICVVTYTNFIIIS